MGEEYIHEGEYHQQGDVPVGEYQQGEAPGGEYQLKGLAEYVRSPGARLEGDPTNQHTRLITGWLAILPYFLPSFLPSFLPCPFVSC